MTLSNQSDDLTAFFSTRKVNLKMPINSSLRQAEIVGPLKMV
jgi:hypothetical protein